MGLETGTFLDDLVTSNPVGATDDTNKGDDHIRLIKSVLKTTFPNATKAFRFESVLTKTTTYSVVAADARALILGDASGGAFVITLPLGSTVFAGYSVIIMKSDSSGDAVTVDGNGAETINGSLTRTLSVRYQGEKYAWDGSEWKVVAVTHVTTGSLLNDAVTFAKMQNITTARLLGRTTASSGDTEEIAIDGTMALSSLTLGVKALGIDTAQLAASAVETAKINNSAVTTAKIAANAVDGTKIALGSDAQGDVMYYDGTNWVRLAAGTADEFLQTKGSGADPVWAVLAGITTYASKTTTSGSTQGFTGIPAGTNRITLMLDGVSLSGTERLLVQLGDAGGYETSVYTSGASGGTTPITSTSGFVLHEDTGNGNAWSGSIVFTRTDGNAWSSNGVLYKGASGSLDISAGRKTLSAELDRIQLTRTGSNTFDGGKINIFTEI